MRPDHRMVISSSAQAHEAEPAINHRRYPSSLPTVKELEDRANFVEQGGQFDNHARKDHHKQSPPELGQAPSVTSIISPTLSRKRSKIKQRRRFMFSSKEVKSQFFYPVNGPRRKRSGRNGKFRNNTELDTRMDYIKIDSSISKDLCLNQMVRTFQIKNILDANPKLTESIKAITIDSDNNYIIYTPHPTHSKNSIFSADKILEEQLAKLRESGSINGDIVSELLNPHISKGAQQIKKSKRLPEIETSLLRTYSLPRSFHNNEKLQAVWNLYLRKTIAMRIQWRLRNSHAPSLMSDTLTREKSLSSSVDTQFFMDTDLYGNLNFPHEYKSPEPLSPHFRSNNSSEDDSRFRNLSFVDMGKYSSNSDSFKSAHTSPRRVAMMRSLEDLMSEANSVISVLN